MARNAKSFSSTSFSTVCLFIVILAASLLAMITMVTGSSAPGREKKPPKVSRKTTPLITITTTTTTTTSWPQQAPEIIHTVSDETTQHLYRQMVGQQQPSLPLSSSVFIDGDIILGGLFPVHERRGSVPCGAIQADRGIQRMEAMLYALDSINRDRSLLGDVRLGADVRDTCSLETHALEEALQYVKASMSGLEPGEYVCADGSDARIVGKVRPVAAVIGASLSSVSTQVANLLRLFKIPQVSYASTSATLSDKSRFEYFARTVPPDSLQAKVMADIVAHFNWTYVSTVASEGDYGERGIDAFRAEARLRNVCIAVSEKVPVNPSTEQLTQILGRLQSRPTAKVVVLFLTVSHARELLRTAAGMNMSVTFTWIASDGWGKQVELPSPRVANGVISVELESKPVEGFDKYFTALTPDSNTRNIWFREYWQAQYNCTFDDHVSVAGQPWTSNNQTAPCTGTEELTLAKHKQENKLQFVFQAVYAVTHALRSLLRDECAAKQYGGGGGGGSKQRFSFKACLRSLRSINGEKLNALLRNTTYEDGLGGYVAFDAAGDGPGIYNVFNLQQNISTGQYEYRIVGRWQGGGLDMYDGRSVRWGSGSPPLSRCSAPCPVGHVKNMQQGEPCCWVCIACQPRQYVVNEMCANCSLRGWWPHDNRTGCYPLPEQHIAWTSLYALVPVIIAGVGVVSTLVVMATFLHHIRTPIVMASGRELSFILLCGCLLCFAMTFVILLRPTPLYCALQRFGMTFSFAVTYSALLTKTNRISRIFDSARLSAKRPAMISPTSQVIVTCLLIAIQVIINVVWLIFEPPDVFLSASLDRPDPVVVKCRLRNDTFLLSLSYNMLLVITCTVYAIKTRKIPENFNESKFIGFTMYTTCVIWLAFVPLYYGTLHSLQIQVTTLCISISLSAYVALACLFLPKMHIILLHPEKNVRKLNMTTSGTFSSAKRRSLATGQTTATPSENCYLGNADGNYYAVYAYNMNSQSAVISQQSVPAIPPPPSVDANHHETVDLNYGHGYNFTS